MLNDLWHRVRSLFQRRQAEQELDDELSFHLEHETAKLMRRGLSQEEAMRQARLAFGGVETTKERTRDARGTRWLEDTAQDLRHALRQWRRSPGFVLTATATLALSIGANTALFQFVNAVLLRTLPVARPQELVLFGTRDKDRLGFSFTHRQREALTASPALAGLCAFRPWSGFRVGGRDGVVLAEGMLAAGNCLNLLGLQPALGRLLSEADERDPWSVMLSYDYWQRAHASDPDVVGRSVDLNGHPFTVVGVLPRGFQGLDPGQAVDLVVPLAAQPVVMPGTLLLRSPKARWLRLLGRLHTGSARQQAQAQVAVIWAGLQQEEINPNLKQNRLELLSGAQGLGELARQYARPLRLLMALISLVLLVACANLASLLLARAGVRGTEIGIRLSLGAGHGRVVRQLLMESLLLALAGGVAGLAVAHGASRTLVGLLSRGRTPLALDLSPEPRVLAYTLVVSLLTGLVFGLMPAWRAVRDQTTPRGFSASRSVAPGRSRWGQALVAGQVALSVLLLGVAALFAHSLVRLHRVDSGFRKDQVLLLSLRPGVAGYTATQAAALYSKWRDRVAALPSVVAAGLSMDTPVGGLSWQQDVGPADASADAKVAAQFNHVSAGFFEAYGIGLTAGRSFTAADEPRPLVVLSDSLSRALFGPREAVGRRVRLGNDVLEVIGVARDVRYRGLREAAERVLYRPYRQQPAAQEELTLAVRTAGNPLALLPAIRAELRGLAPDLPVYAVHTLEAQVDAGLTTERLMTVLSASLGLLALLLAAIGLYGTVAYAVARRTREMGIRLALGARPARVRGLVLRQAMGPVWVGMGFGIPLALAGGQLAQSMLFGITPGDLASHGGAVALLLGAAALAAYLPARRAATADPAAVLRQE